MTTATMPATSPIESSAHLAHSLADGGMFTPNWGILAIELAVVFFLFALIVGLIAWLTRRKRIKAARFLLDERDRLADNAAETFNQHCLALRPDHPLSEQEFSDYQQRSFDLIGALIAPWLTPSPAALQQATREIMTIRHNDLHQIAAIFRNNTPPADSAQNETQILEVAQLQHELASSQQAERERSAQLAEALKSVSIIVSEYGRKSGADADYKVPQILRALLYLQATDEGLDSTAAKHSADSAMASGIQLVSAEENLAPDAINTKAAPNESPAPAATQGATNEPPAIKQAAIAAITEKTSAIAAMQAQPPAAKPAPTTEKPEPTPDIKANTPTIPHKDETLIELDEIEIPTTYENTADFNLDLDDIDALLDAEIARQQAVAPPESKKLPTLDDDLDLSKKP